MLLKINLNNGTRLDFDTEDLPLKDDLQPFLEILNEKDIPLSEQYKIAHLYRFHFDECKAILDSIKSNNKGCEKDVDLLYQALNLQHQKQVILDETRGHKQNILLGFVAYMKKDYSKALSYFSKERFAFGISLCDYFFGIPENDVLKALIHLKNIDTKEFEASKEKLKLALGSGHARIDTDDRFSEFIQINKNVLQDIMFCLRLVDNYCNDTNIDVKHRKIVDLINEGKYKEAEEMLLRFNLGDNNYLLGKIEHLKGNFNEAKQFYKKCISEGESNTRNYILSKYAYERIVQETPLPFKYDSEELNDLNTFLRLKNNGQVGDLSCCSKDFHNFITINKGVRENSESCIIKYDLLRNNKYIEKYVFNNNLIYLRMKKKALFYGGEASKLVLINEEYDKLLKDAIEEAPDNVKEATLYNQAYLTLDKDSFGNLRSKQSKIMNAFLRKDYEALKNMGLIELSSCLKDETGAIELLSNKNSLYSNLILGKLYLDKHIQHGSNIDLSFAIKYFLKETKSFYAANGLGICLALQKKYPEAIKVFSSVILDHKSSHINLGNVYFLNQEYEKGVLEYLKCHSKSLESAIMRYKDFINVDLMIVTYKQGYESLRNIIFEKLISENRLEEAKDYKTSDKKLKNMFENKLKENKNKSDELKRKIEELEKYKRSKNIK